MQFNDQTLKSDRTLQITVHCVKIQISSSINL